MRDENSDLSLGFTSTNRNVNNINYILNKNTNDNNPIIQ